MVIPTWEIVTALAFGVLLTLGTTVFYRPVRQIEYLIERWAGLPEFSETTEKAIRAVGAVAGLAVVALAALILAVA